MEEQKTTNRDPLAFLKSLGVPVVDWRDTPPSQVFKSIQTPICEEDDLYLCVDRMSEDDGRFAAVFRKTWLKIPEDHRAAMVEHWRTDCCGKQWVEHLYVEHSPFILLADFKDSWFEGPTGDAIGQCNHNGHELSFRGPYCDQMPTGILELTIAHELGHAYLTKLDPEHGNIKKKKDYLEFESQVHDLLRESWGMDERKQWAWCDLNKRQFRKWDRATLKLHKEHMNASQDSSG